MEKLHTEYISKLTESQNERLLKIINANGTSIARETFDTVGRDGLASVAEAFHSNIINIRQSYHDPMYDFIAQNTNITNSVLTNPLRLAMPIIQTDFVNLCVDGLNQADKTVAAIQHTMDRILMTMKLAPQHIVNMPKNYVPVSIPYVLDSFTNFIAVHKDQNVTQYMENINNNSINACEDVVKQAAVQLRAATDALRSLMKNQTEYSADIADTLFDNLQSKTDSTLVDVVEMKLKAEDDVNKNFPKQYDGISPPNYMLSTVAQEYINSFVDKVNQQVNAAVNDLIHLFERSLGFPF